MAENNYDAPTSENMGMELDPAEQLRELKANYVPKSELDQAIADRNKYFKMAITNYHDETEVEQKPVDLNELRKNLFSDLEHKTNLEYAEQALKLRTAIMEKSGVDPCVPQGRKIAPTTNDYYVSQRVADGLQYCIDMADGDPTTFMTVFKKITI